MNTFHFIGLFAMVVSEVTGQSKIQNRKSKIVVRGLKWLAHE